MLYSIFSFVLDVATGLLVGACLLRAYMQWVRAPFVRPLGPFVLAMTDWIVLPLRRFLAGRARLDIASIVAALVLELAQFGVLWLVSGMAASALGALPVLALVGVVRVAISGLIGLILVQAILSWVQPERHALSDTLERLCAPLLAPVRRHLPLIGGIDLSPLVVLVLLQIVAMVLGSVQFGMLH